MWRRPNEAHKNITASISKRSAPLHGEKAEVWMTYRNRKLLNEAKDRPCVLCGSIGTTVAAHSNSLAHGRGFAHKTPDYMTAWVCMHHHDLIDGRAGKLTKEEKREMWMDAWVKTVAIWFDEGIVK